MKNTNILLIVFLIVFVGGSCTKSDSVSPGIGADSSDVGVGGSTACFTIVGDHLYTVGRNEMHIFDISDENKIERKGQKYLSWNVETIFPFNDLLLVGTMQGVQIYSIDAAPSNPELLGKFRHVTACDPVVAEGNYAYATIREDSWCGGGRNALFILDISNPVDIVKLKEIGLDSPKGLGVRDNFLYVCDSGLKVYNVENHQDPLYVRKYDIDCHDVIPVDDVLFVIGKNGFYQYRIEGDNLELLSTILVEKNK